MGKRKLQWPTGPRGWSWLVDGHNLIFAHPELERLQTGGERAEARRRLEQLLERFAVLHGVRVLVVYDGSRVSGSPKATRRGRVHTLYSCPPEVADDRIVVLAQRATRQGRKVAVVSSDRALGSRLPSGALRVEPRELFRRLRPAGAREEGAEVIPDLKDVEEFFLAHDEEKAKTRGAGVPRGKREGTRRRGGR